MFALPLASLPGAACAMRCRAPRVEREGSARTGGSVPLSRSEFAIDNQRILGDLKMFEPKTKRLFLAVRDREER